MPGFPTEAIAAGTHALLDKLIVVLRDKGVVDDSDLKRIVSEAVADVGSSPEPNTAAGADFLQYLYGSPG